MALRMIGLLLVLAATAACGSSPLPRGEIPPDFYFFYRSERPFPGPDGSKAGPVPAKPGPAKKVDIPKPVLIQIELESDGTLEYEIQHLAPRPAQWKEQKTLTPENLRKAYGLVRDADLFDMEDRYVGEDDALGTETFYVMGTERKSKEVIVKGTAVPSLASLRNGLFNVLKLRWTPPKETITGYTLDLRSGKIHRAGCSQLPQVPAASQQKNSRVESLINVQNSFPCEECRPLEPR